MKNNKMWLCTVAVAICLSLASCATESIELPKQSSPPSVSVNPTSIAVDAPTLFANNCSVCHGERRQGMFRQGGALTPDRLKDVADDTLISIISSGIQYAGMPTWKSRLSAEEIQALAKFIKYTPP